MVICQQDRIEHTCPILPQGVDKSDPVWSQVNMRYLKTSQDLQKYAACLHLASVPPAVVIVDSLSSFLQSRLSSHRCLLLMCDEGGSEGPRSLYICERWCPLILTIQPGTQSKFVLSALPAMAEKHLMHPSCFSCLHYSTSHSALTLDSITQPAI
ncbi:hypothetical protein ABBQ38_002074 [Trebouxia sp. C0009 RCD-2024]